MLIGSLFHLHTPKTAGTTLRRVVEDNLDGGELLASVMDREMAALLAGQELLPVLDRFSFLSGHFPLRLRGMLKPPVVTVCSIRDPVELVVSYFHYQQAAGLVPAEVCLERFLESEAVQAVINLQSRFIAGENLPAVPDDPAAFSRAAASGVIDAACARFAGAGMREAVDRGMETIDFVVDVADLPGGIGRLCAALGWMVPPNLPLRNAARHPRPELSQATRRRIARLCELDEHIYQRLRARPFPPAARPVPAMRSCGAGAPVAIDFSATVDGDGWHLREFDPDWGWSRWSTARSRIRTALRLPGGTTCLLRILLLDCRSPAALDSLTICLAGSEHHPRFVREHTAWRGYVEIEIPEGGLTVNDITLLVPDASPLAEAALGGDNRQLGVRVQSLIIIQSGGHPHSPPEDPGGRKAMQLNAIPLIEYGEPVTATFHGRQVAAQSHRDSGYVFFSPPPAAELTQYYQHDYPASQVGYYTPDIDYEPGKNGYHANRIMDAYRLVLGGAPATSLELGCSFGGVVAEMARRGVDSAGSDINADAVAQGRRVKANLRISPASNLDALRTMAGRVDLIYSLHALEHDPDIFAVIEACRDRLSDDGLLYVAVPNAMAASSVLDGFTSNIWVNYPQHLHMLSPGCIPYLCEQTNFVPVFWDTRIVFGVQDNVRTLFKADPMGEARHAMWDAMLCQAGHGMELNFVLAPAGGAVARRVAERINLVRGELDHARRHEVRIRTYLRDAARLSAG